jgi:phosphoglucomutase
MRTGVVLPTGLPNSNVVYYDMADGSWLCVRPSGTEPKVKFYYGVIGKSMEEAQQLSKEFGEAVVNMIENML